MRYTVSLVWSVLPCTKVGDTIKAVCGLADSSIDLLPSHHRTYLLLNKRIPFKAAQDECSLRFRPRGHSQTRLMAEYLRVRVGVVSGFDQVDSLPSSDSTYNPFVLRKPSFTPSFTPILISLMLGITDHSKRSRRSNTNLNGAERSKFIEFRGRQSALLPPTYLPSTASLVGSILAKSQATSTADISVHHSTRPEKDTYAFTHPPTVRNSSLSHPALDSALPRDEERVHKQTKEVRFANPSIHPSQSWCLLLGRLILSSRSL